MEKKNIIPPLKAKVQKSLRKNIRTFMDVHGMLPVHAVPEGKTVNAQYYAKFRCFRNVFASGI